MAKIYSYNKSYRPNSTETSNPSYGRSKGQIKVNWFGAGCSNSITFDVYKNFVNALPAIVGPTCLKPNTQYTYSVDRIVSDNTNDNIGFDSYYWTGLPGSILTSNGFYTSADNSSITFTTGSSVLPIPNLQCCYGRVNPNTGDGGLSSVTTTPVVGAHTTCVSAPIIIVAPSPPTYTTGFAPPTCVPTGTVASPAIFTIQYPNIASGLTYTWTAANTGWIDPVTNLTFTPVVNTTSGFTNLTINTAGNNNPGELTLTITGSCDPAIYKYQINRNITAPLTIVPTGSTTTCLAGTSSGNTFTISPTNSNGVTWYLTAINSSIQINPLGVTLLNSDTSTVTINTSGSSFGSFWLNVKSSTTTCGNSSINTVINIRPAAPIFTATTPSCIVRNTTAITSVGVTPVTGATYDWTPLPAGVTCTANCNSANPSFVFNSVAGVTSITLNVKVIGLNGCNSTSTSRVINYIAVSKNFSSGFPDQYAVSNNCGAVISWTVGTALGNTTYTTSTGNVGLSSVPNTGPVLNNVLTLSGNSANPVTSVCANLTGGIQVCASLPLGTYTQRQSSSIQIDKDKNVIISPNPNTGNFTIKVINFTENASAKLTDFDGNEIKTYQLIKGDTKIVKEDLQKGTYFVILNIDGIKETRQVIIK